MAEEGFLPDLREKTTLTAWRFLQAGYHVLLTGGPKMGKTFLGARLLARMPDLEFMDDRRQPERVVNGTDLDRLTGCLAGKKSPVLWVIPTTRYFRLGRPRLPRTRHVPLIGCMPRDLKKNYPELPDLFDRTLGHPYLVQGILAGCFEENLLELKALWRDLLGQFPEAAAMLDDLVKHRTLDPQALYRRAVRQFKNPRVNLDLLCHAGLVTRMLYGEEAGIRVQPVSINWSKNVSPESPG